LRLHGFVLWWIALLFFGIFFDFFVRFKELPYVTRYFFGDFVDFTASLFYVFVKSNALLNCRYCGKRQREWVNFLPLFVKVKPSATNNQN
jgi:hypothetical protein